MGRPLICGGWLPNERLQDCFFVQEKNQGNQKISMIEQRAAAAVVVLNGKK